MEHLLTCPFVAWQVSLSMSFLFEDQRDFIPIHLTPAGSRDQQTSEATAGSLLREQVGIAAVLMLEGNWRSLRN